MRAAHDPGPRAVGIRLPLGEQLGGQCPGRGTLARATRAMEQIGVRGMRGRAERRREDRPCMGMSFELGEHQIRS